MVRAYSATRDRPPARNSLYRSHAQPHVHFARQLESILQRQTDKRNQDSGGLQVADALSASVDALLHSARRWKPALRRRRVESAPRFWRAPRPGRAGAFREIVKPDPNSKF